jgi:ATP-dependent Clp protease ATP-binding subunit ClpA
VPAPTLAKELQAALRAAFDEATRRRHEYVTLEHLLLGLLGDPRAARGLRACGADLGRLRRELETYLSDTVEALPENVEPSPQTTLSVERVLQRAAIHVMSSDQQVIDGAAVLVQMFKERESRAVFLLESEGVTSFDLKQYFSHGITPERDGEEDEETEVAGEDGADRGGPDEEKEDGESDDPAKDPLAAYCTDLNAEAAAGRIDPLIGRRHELDRAVQVLCRRRKNNPVFVGDPGVGKTAIVEGLALHVHEGKVPDAIGDARIYALDMGALLAGTKYRGQFEQRLKGVLKRLQKIPGAILFIDEIHTIVGAGAVQGGSMDASNILKPALASGKIRCIGSTTYEEYKQSFERDRALARRFQKIEVGEPSEEDAVAILEGLRSRYEEHHHVTYAAGAIEAAVKLSSVHLRERLLPDKAIDVIDEAGARVRLDGGTEVTVADIERVVARIARIPEKTVSASERDKLRDLEGELKSRIFGQDRAIEAVVSAIKLSRAGLRSGEKPIGSFLFAGPTGVGKTELARQLAQVLGVELIRFDMSEYGERHTVSRLIGAPPGYVGFDQGGLLTDAVRKHPHSVVVLDEIEKAHPEIFNILLQVMDHATLTDNNGRKADFRNVVLILTTNAGARELATRTIGFGGATATARGATSANGPDLVDETKARSAIEKLFTPEFRNRLDAQILFRGLTPEVILRVVDKEIAQLQAMLDERKVRLEPSPAARAWLAERGYDPAMGARPMARLVEQQLKRKLADALLFGALRDAGGVARVDVEGDELVLHVDPAN